MTVGGDEVFKVIELVVGIFKHCGVQYAVGGSVASSVHGDFRTTNGIDLIADFSDRQLLHILASAESSFYVYKESAIESVGRGKSFNIIHKDSFIKVDIFPVTSEYERREISRSQELTIPFSDFRFSVVSPEDSILTKMVWYQKGGLVSERQWRDIEGVYQANRKNLDYSFLKDAAKELGVVELLCRLVEEK